MVPTAMMDVPSIPPTELAISHWIGVEVPITVVPNLEMVSSLGKAWSHSRRRRFRCSIRTDSPYRYIMGHINRESTNPNYDSRNDSNINSNASPVYTPVRVCVVDTMYGIVLPVSIAISFRNKSRDTIDFYWSDVVDERPDFPMVPLEWQQLLGFPTRLHWRARHIRGLGTPCDGCHKNLLVPAHLRYSTSTRVHSLHIHDDGNVLPRRWIMYTKSAPIVVDESSPCWWCSHPILPKDQCSWTSSWTGPHFQFPNVARAVRNRSPQTYR